MTLLIERPVTPTITSVPAPVAIRRGGSYVTVPGGRVSAGAEGGFVSAPGNRAPRTRGSYVTAAGAPVADAAASEGSYITLLAAA